VNNLSVIYNQASPIVVVAGLTVSAGGRMWDFC